MPYCLPLFKTERYKGKKCRLATLKCDSSLLQSAFKALKFFLSSFLAEQVLDNLVLVLYSMQELERKVSKVFAERALRSLYILSSAYEKCRLSILLHVHFLSGLEVMFQFPINRHKMWRSHLVFLALQCL